jgi:hypothetical protein
LFFEDISREKAGEVDGENFPGSVFQITEICLPPPPYGFVM